MDGRTEQWNLGGVDDIRQLQRRDQTEKGLDDSCRKGIRERRDSTTVVEKGSDKGFDVSCRERVRHAADCLVLLFKFEKLLICLFSFVLGFPNFFFYSPSSILFIPIEVVTAASYACLCTVGWFSICLSSI